MSAGGLSAECMRLCGEGGNTIILMGSSVYVGFYQMISSHIFWHVVVGNRFTV